MTYSIDLSHLNAPFDWSKLSHDVNLVILKVSEGLTFADKMLSHYLSEVKAKDLDYGLYYFLHPDSPGVPQANNFCDTSEAAGVKWDDPKLTLIACDIENTSNDGWVEDNKSTAIRNALDSAEAVQKRTGLKPFIYTYPGFWKPTFGDTHLFSGYSLWEANYSDKPMIPFGGWQNLTLHQFSQRGSYKSSNDGGDIDWSRTTYTIDELKAFSKAL